MTTYQTSLLSEILESGKISSATRAYFQDRLRNRIYDIIINELISTQKQNPLFTQSELSARIGKRPEQISRWLSSPGNWTLDTISDLLLGISGAELGLSVTKLSDPRFADSDMHDSTNQTFIEPDDIQPKTAAIPTTPTASNVVTLRIATASVGTSIPQRYPYPNSVAM